MESKNVKRIIIANWKMNPSTLAEAKDLFNAVKREAKRIESVDLIIAPPVIWLGQLRTKEDNEIKFAAQNMSWEEKGALTGEISPLMIKDASAKYVILGHSERRIYFGENNEMINAKISSAFKNNLGVIYCVGETAREKRDEKTQEIIEAQIKEGLKDVSQGQVEVNKLIIAYEPVWAIGSGEVPTFDEALSANLLIKKTLAGLYNRNIAEKTPILYGGSVDARNAKDFIAKGGMDGLLVGGASLKASEFGSIMRQLNF